MKDMLGFILLSLPLVLSGCRDHTSEPTPSNLPLEIAFTSDQSGNDDIYLMASDGSSQTRITTNPDKDWFPKWSRDGRQIAFLSTRNGDTQLYLMKGDGTDQLKVSTGLTFVAGYEDIQWSPTGRFIAFTGFDDRAVRRIYIVNADGTNQRMLTAGSFPNWMHAEDRLICAGNGIFSIAIDGSNPTRLTDTTSFDFDPVLSPREDKIVFRSDRDNESGSASLHIMNIDGTGLRELTHKDVDGRATWAPNGSAIMFLYSQHLGNRPKMFEIDTSGANEMLICDLGTISSVGPFSPSGDRIVFSSLPDNDLRIDIYVKNLIANSIQRLTTSTNVIAPRNEYADWRQQ